MTVSNLVTGHKLLVVTLGTSLSHHTGDFDGFSQIHLQIFPALLCENIFRHLDTVICKGISKQLAWKSKLRWTLIFPIKPSEGKTANLVWMFTWKDKRQFYDKKGHLTNKSTVLWNVCHTVLGSPCSHMGRMREGNLVVNSSVFGSVFWVPLRWSSDVLVSHSAILHPNRTHESYKHIYNMVESAHTVQRCVEHAEIEQKQELEAL